MKRCEFCRKMLLEHAQHVASRNGRTFVACLSCKELTDRLNARDAYFKEEIQRKFSEIVARMPPEDRALMLEMLDKMRSRSDEHKVFVLKNRGPAQDHAPKLKYER